MVVLALVLKYVPIIDSIEIGKAKITFKVHNMTDYVLILIELLPIILEIFNQTMYFENENSPIFFLFCANPSVLL